MKAAERELVAKRVSEIRERLATAKARAKEFGERLAKETYGEGTPDARNSSPFFELGALQQMADSAAGDLQALVDVYLAPRRRRAA